jgi:hypothetical protein
MSGYIQSGTMVQGNPPAPTISGVTANNTLICTFGSDAAQVITAPTDSAGGTWVIDTQTNANGQTIAILHLFNAAAGTHTLTFSTGGSSQACISEWNGITGIGNAGASNTKASSTTITTPSYTPSQANEVVIACFVENGNNANDQNQCTTAAFQAIGSASDFGSHSCLGIMQNGAAGSSGEFNGDIVTTTSALTATYTWLSAATSASAIQGYQYTPATPTATIAWTT